MTSPQSPQRVLLLTTPSSYRAEAFLTAALQLGIIAEEVIDSPPELAKDCPLAIDFRTDGARDLLQQYAADHPLAAIIAVDDSGSMLAAEASAALGLPHNSPDTAIAARNKYVMRTLLKQGGVRVPTFTLHTLDEDLDALAQRVDYPCVVKPLELNGSRGVIRANTPQEFMVAVRRLAAILHAIYPSGNAPVTFRGEIACDSARSFLVEAFIPGFEVALEGLLDHGQLQVLALFDKPDPLDGPFFEETIYVTPSRLPEAVQLAIQQCAAESAKALGLHNGPVHAEMRINEAGPWLVEAAGRSIGGLCSKTLRFGTDASLEELILRQACGLPVDSLGRDGNAGGVMMIPIPDTGVLRAVHGVEEALAVAGIESVEISAPLHNPIIPLPEGESYLGFIFARSTSPDTVEAALREAHAQLTFTIVPNIELARV
ncbi:MAG: ATP-grasp domain-containing protein [Roseiflexaceae bacterium]|nr:ATP-grasp domain-containing protein [Roseiflexaceae bacterium]